MRNYDADGYVDGRSGHHVGEGWFVAGGADLPAAGAQPRIHELDLLATVHALLGQPMRPGMRGRPVAAMLPAGSGAARLSNPRHWIRMLIANLPVAQNEPG